MKRFVSALLVVLLLMAPCGLTASAGDDVIVIADNYNSLTYCGETYVFVANTDGIDYDYTEDENDFILTPRQSAELRSVNATVSVNRAFVDVHMQYKTGGYDNRAYVVSHRLEEYENLLNGIGDVYATTIDYASFDEIVMTEAQLKGEAIVRAGGEIKSTNQFAIWIKSYDGCFSTIGGALLVDEYANEYYYLDYYQYGLDERYNLMKSLDQYEQVTLYRITDAALLSRIETDYDAYYSNQLMPYNDVVGKTLSSVMMILLFGVLPLLALVIAVIGWIRSKTATYRRLFTALTVVCTAELASFATVCIICLMK